jgi:hypothetical protein
MSHNSRGITAVKNPLIKYLAAALAALAFAAPASAAEPQGRETVFEVHVNAITLPARDGDDVSIKVCSSCNTRVLRTSDRTIYRIGDTVVGLAVMREHFKLNPDALTAISLSDDHRELLELYTSPPRL